MSVTGHTAFNMAPIFLILALVTQCSFTFADTDALEDKEELNEVLLNQDIDDEDIKLPLSPLDPNWFAMPNNMFPASSLSMMAHVVNSNKSMEEQLIDINTVAKQISKAIEDELTYLHTYALAHLQNKTDEQGNREKRSVDTPMDSSQLVMRLLNHIKSNNEYQNVAIEKMMTAQEIADKFGIEFNPDPEILADLAIAANEHAQEMTSLLKDACSLKNVTTEKIEFIPVIDEPKKENDTYYIYGTDHISEKNVPSYEYMPDVISKPSVNHVHAHNSYNYPYESQINSPPVHHHSAPVTPKPSIYDQYLYPFTPADYSAYCSMEPMMPFFIPVEEPEPEPELVGEEVEETITSRMIVEKGDEPGSTTVNHVTSYTISEKSHFKPPQIDTLPQHFQYCFFLI